MGLARIKIDTGSVKIESSEITLYLKSLRAEEIKNLLLKRDSNVRPEKDNITYKANLKDLLLYSLVSNTIINGIGIIFVLYNIVDDYIVNVFEINIFNDFKFLEENSLIGLFLIVISILALSFCLSIINTLIKYYKFNIYLKNEKLNISYGLLNRKNYSFDRKKIKGVHIKQNLLMQLLGLYFLEIEGIGYGDEKGEQAILYPICKEKVKIELIRQILPEFIFKNKVTKPSRKTLFRFIFKKIVFMAIIICFLSYYFSYGYISILLLPVFLVLGYMEYKNTALGIGDRLIYMSYNGFYKTQSIIKISAVQSLIFSTSYFQKQQEICDIGINIFSNDYGKSIKVKNLNNNLANAKTIGI